MDRIEAAVFWLLFETIFIDKLGQDFLGRAFLRIWPSDAQETLPNRIAGLSRTGDHKVVAL
jgi:hypothetical protein